MNFIKILDTIVLGHKKLRKRTKPFLKKDAISSIWAIMSRSGYGFPVPLEFWRLLPTVAKADTASLIGVLNFAWP